MNHGRSHQFDALAPRSDFYQGPYGRLCPDLPPWWPVGVSPQDVAAHLAAIASQEMVEMPGISSAQLAADAGLTQSLDEHFSSRTPAGYTYFGQFIDHDITFDPASSLMRQTDPNGLLNHRTPRLDLDNLYGRGPVVDPFLYDQQQPGKFLIGRVAGTTLPDLPRNRQGRALIGDGRNDENAIVAQLHLAFLLAHNTLVDRARAAGADDVFDTARRTLRWLYQHIVWHDFVSRLCNRKTVAAALTLTESGAGLKTWRSGLRQIYSWKNQPFMPVEFSVAAYRFGHSMVRNGYQTNFPHRGFARFVPIFAPHDDDAQPDDLRGFRPLQKQNVVQWDWFLQMRSSRGPFPQRARKIDTKLANALTSLPIAGARRDAPVNVLAFRNLQRGLSQGLPAGTEVASQFGVTPLRVAQDHDALWYYILKEAESLPGLNAGQQLGRVGSAIVAATFAGLLRGDPRSWLNMAPCWTPDDEPLLDAAQDNQDGIQDNGKSGASAQRAPWGLASIIRLSGLPASAEDFQRTPPSCGASRC